MRSVILNLVFLFSITTITTGAATPSFAQDDIESLLSREESDGLSHFAQVLGRAMQKRMELDAAGTHSYKTGSFLFSGPDEVITPGSGDEFGDPSDDASDYGGADYPLISKKSGAADKIAFEVLYQTLMYHGVVHLIQKNEEGRYAFKVIQSKSGYFRDLTTLDIAFAVREFSRYLVALLCNDPSQTNFYRLFAQVPVEEIGFRFKHDMTWTLLGNRLPKQPNKVFELGGKWEALNKILSSTKSIETLDNEAKSELRGWWRSLTDVVNLMVRLNKLTCYVDARPNPREELKKRKINRDLMSRDSAFYDRYSKVKEVLSQAKKAGNEAKIEALKNEDS